MHRDAKRYDSATNDSANKAKAISAKLLELNLKVQLAILVATFGRFQVGTYYAFWFTLFGAFW